MNKQRLSIGIFGGTGFVGSHLGPRLSAAGHELRIFSRGYHLSPELAVLSETRLKRIEDFEAATLADALSGCDVAINLIGILNEKGRDGSGFQRVHVEYTQKILEACQTAGVPRYLHMSSLRAGEGSSHYLKSRGASETLVRQNDQVDWTIFQPSVIFGERDGFLARFAGLLKLAPAMPLACPGARFSPVFVGDVVTAMSNSIADRNTFAQTFQLCGPTTYTLRELVYLIRNTLGLGRPIIGLPDWVSRLQAGLLDFVPGKPFSTDNYRSLQVDSVCNDCGSQKLEITPTPLESVISEILCAPEDEQRLTRARSSHSFVEPDD